MLPHSCLFACVGSKKAARVFGTQTRNFPNICDEFLIVLDDKHVLDEGESSSRRYGDTVGIDWENPVIVQLIEDYLTKKIRSLEVLCWRILEHTGITVSKMTLSRRLNGKSFSSVVCSYFINKSGNVIAKRNFPEFLVYIFARHFLLVLTVCSE